MTTRLKKLGGQTTTTTTPMWVNLYNYRTLILPEQVYRLLFIVGIVLTVVFSIVHYRAWLPFQQLLMDRKRELILATQKPIETTTSPTTATTTRTAYNSGRGGDDDDDDWLYYEDPLVDLHGPVMTGLVGLLVLLWGINLQNDLSQWVGIVLVVSVVVFNRCFYPPVPQPPNKHQRLQRKHQRALAVAASCFLACVVSMACFGRYAQPIANYRYKGPMPIVGYNLLLQNQEGGWACDTKEFSQGLLQVAWGGQWGCPHLDGKVCKTYVTTPSCRVEPVCYPADNDDYFVCNDNSYQCTEQEDAEQEVTDCIEALYPEAAEYLANYADKEYDPTSTDDPISEGGWPTTQQDLYGDCSTCTAQWDNVFELEHNALLLSRLNCLTCLGLGLFFLVWAVWLHRRMSTLAEMTTNFLPSASTTTAVELT